MGVCLAGGHLKQACKVVKSHDLQMEFPAIATGGVAALRAQDWAHVSAYVASRDVVEFVKAANEHFQQTNGAGGQMRKFLDHCLSQVLSCHKLC